MRIYASEKLENLDADTRFGYTAKMTDFELSSRDVGCPYCGETINIDIDCSVESQNYVEDCQVCCRPIVIDVAVANDGSVEVSLRSEDE